MEFPYRRQYLPKPAPDGRSYRARPILSVTVIGPSAGRPLDCLADSGADDTVFPEDLAAQLGIDLANAPTGTASGVGMVGSTLRFALVTLRVADGTERREWQAWVGFTSTTLRRPIAGQAGFLEFFTAAYHGDDEKLMLDVNTRYSGK